jgi:hypothetical protein
MYQQQAPQPHDEREWQGANPEYNEGYRSAPPYNDPVVDPGRTQAQTQMPSGVSFGQAPIQARTWFGQTSQSPAGMRLALAIVSVVMLVPLTGIALGALGPFAGLIALGIICAAILGINYTFNSRI